MILSSIPQRGQVRAWREASVQVARGKPDVLGSFFSGSAWLKKPERDSRGW
jgi:hypothetical protein